MATLTQKLFIKPGKNWLLFNAPANYSDLLAPLPEGSTVTTLPTGNFDGIQLFVKSKNELSASLKIIVPLLKQDTIFWISYPKKSSGIESDLKMGSWDELTQYGLDGVSSIAVDETWAGSRFRPLGQAKISGVGNQQIRQNEYSEYIDVDTKQIKLPPQLAEVLQQNPQAMAFYNQLSYSNKKEYVLWILTAKQEKTREDRLIKLVEKLAAGKKNPSEK